MRLFILLVTLTLIYFNSYAQTKYTISGVIKSKEKGETLIGVTVRAGESSTVSNEYGFYSLSVSESNVEISFSAVGFTGYTETLQLTEDTKLNISLEEEVKSLDNVIVTAQSRGRSLSSPQMGVDRLSTREIKNIPVLFGERDILKTIQLLPGIKSAGDGNSGFFVRGGAVDQNLILLDEAPVYNASHLLGFFSTFNSEAIKDMQVYKGGMPAQYGGRLSSVLDIKMNDGSNQGYHVSGGIGLISSRLNIEGPIQKEKSSFLLTGRRTYADLFLKLSKDSAVNQNVLYFYDFNTKLNFEINDKNHLYLSGYFGKDVLGVGKTFGIDWGNGTGTVRWNHVFNNRLFTNTSLIFSNYKYNISINTGNDDFDILSEIRDYNIKQEYQYYLNDKNTIRFGFNSIYHIISPGEVRAKNSQSVNSSALQKRNSWENAVFVSNTQRVTDKLNLSYGLRVSSFSIIGPGDYFSIDNEGNVTDTFNYKPGEFVKTYINPEPRFSASYLLNSLSSVKFSYARNIQNLHLLSSSASSNPTDKWIASTNIIKPEKADQVSIGYYRDIFNSRYELSMETYYKRMENQIDYRNGANIFENNDAIEKQLLFGKGRAYGMEWLLRKKAGKLTGWVSYTLAKTERQIDGINENKWYNARQDRTHDLAIVGSYQLNKKWTISANWIYYTGDAVTFPAGKYQVDNQTLFYYTERNGYRMPNYHRLDLGATCILKQKKKFSSELTISLYNAYGRENAYAINFREKEDNPEQIEAVRFALFKYIPSISYNFKF